MQIHSSALQMCVVHFFFLFTDKHYFVLAVHKVIPIKYTEFCSVTVTNCERVSEGVDTVTGTCITIFISFSFALLMNKNSGYHVILFLNFSLPFGCHVFNVRVRICKHLM